MVVMGALGAGAFWRRKRHPEPAELATDPAAELRARLDASKVVVPDDAGVATREEERVEEAAGSAAEQPPEAAPDDPASRRAAIHARARGAIDELR
jgi:hypothetical protein